MMFRPRQTTHANVGPIGHPPGTGKITSLLPMRHESRDPQLRKRNHSGDIRSCDFRRAVVLLEQLDSGE